MQTPVLKSLSLGSLGTRVVLWMLASSLGAVAMAQETQEVEADDPPERIARLSYTQGGVSLQAVGETEWAQAVVNRPLTPGDYLRTEPDGRAEVQVGEAAIRLGSGAGFSFVSLEERALRVRVSSGVINVRVRELGENDIIEVETPQAVASILRPGNYRLEVDSTGAVTVVKVSSGMLEASGGGQSLVVRAQQTARLTGSGRFAYTTGTLGAPDSFDEWTLERDLRLDNALSTESAKYVSSDVVGYEDLDSNGTWRSEPEYGYVWTPTRVVSGWSPYRYGRYSYVGGWGWTWIDDAPWGFAPFHYGNWVTIGGRWGWVPGPRHGRHFGRPIHDPSDGHSWRVPRTPRGNTVHSVPANGLRAGDVPSTFPGTGYGVRGDGGGYGARDRGGVNNGDTRYSTTPNGGGGYRNGGRYLRPDVPRNDPRVGTPSTGMPGGADDRRMRIPRNELPGNTFPRNESRNETRMPGGRAGWRTAPSNAEPSRQMTRPEAARPAPQQQQPQPAAQPNTSRGGYGNGGGRSQSGGGRPRTYER